MRLPPRLLLAWACALAAAASPAPSPAATLTVKGHAFLLDGRPFDMWGVRTASASQTQELTDHLIAQLDDYKAHGVNTVSVFYMGSSGGYADPFAADGTAIDPSHQKRMEAIIRACDRRGMVVVVGVFYQRAAAPRLKDWDAATEAVRTVARALAPHRNVILNVANEQNHATYRRLPWGRVMNVPDLLDLCRAAKAAAPGLLVGAGGYDHDKNEAIGRSDAVDVLLFDTAGPMSSGQLYERFRAAGVPDKPMVNVETFGGWTNQFVPQGVFPDAVRRAYRNEVADAARHPGLYLHFHNTPWCQPFTPGDKARYDLGGRGTAADPCVRWYFEAVKQARAAPAAGREPAAPAPPPPAFEETAGYVVIEAEALRRSPVWEVNTEPKGYTGAGWVR
jgi:hypothetical protein